MIRICIIVFAAGIVCGAILAGGEDETFHSSPREENRQWKNLLAYDGTLRGQERIEDKY